MPKPYIVFILVTPSFKQRFSVLKYGSVKKAKEAAGEACSDYIKDTGKTAYVVKEVS